MSANAFAWKKKRHEDGREVLFKTVHCDNLEQSFGLAYSKDDLPFEYEQYAKNIDTVLDVKM